MYCKDCGKELQEGSNECPFCGTKVVGVKPLSREIAETVKARSRDALNTFKIFAVNPVGGLQPAYENLESKQAMGVGIVFAVVFDLCIILGLYLAFRKFSGWFPYLGGIKKFGIGDIFKLIIAGSIPFVSIAASSTILRRVFRGSGSIEGDIFIAGASILPVGFLVLFSGILGMGNIEVISVLALFALCYTILIIFTGCTRISKISDAGAALAVPIMLLLSGWFSKIIFSALM